MMATKLDDPLEAYSPRASLAALGVKLERLGLFTPIRQQVKIPQKTIRHTPTDKLYDAFITILAGAQALVELNKILRADLALQKAFGRSACAEQSTVQDTLDACTRTNVEQLEKAVRQIYQHFSRGYLHNYNQRPQLLDLDFTPKPCGKQAEGACKGYFGRQRNHFGRQVGSVNATYYQETVVERLYQGNVQLNTHFQELVWAAEMTLDLNSTTRRRTILRVGGGAGTLANINWALSLGYYYHGKEYSGQHNTQVLSQVQAWLKDPQEEGRELGWVSGPNPYDYPVKRLVTRHLQKKGEWSWRVIVSNLSSEMVLEQTGQSAKQ